MGFALFTAWLRKAAAVSAALALAACGAVPTGERVQAELPTFVSLNPCLDAILVEVAAPDQVLALSHYSRDPAASSMDPARAAQFGVTGGTAEEVIALRPDIVLASSFIAPATRSALEGAGLTVATFGSPSSVEESLLQIRELAALTQREDRGDALIASIADTRAPTGVARPSAMLWQPGQIVAGETSLVADHLEWAGFTSHAAAQGLGQADYVALETVLANPPDLLLVAGDAPGQEHPVLSKLADTQVKRFEPRLFYCAGPSILAARERLLAIRSEMGSEMANDLGREIASQTESAAE